MSQTKSAALEVEALSFGFVNRPSFLGPIGLAVSAGQCWAIVGPNGAGKTTLLRLMAGLLRPSAGRVLLGGKPLLSIGGRDRARRIAYVPQHVDHDLDFSAADVVLMGRFPHRTLGLFDSANDRVVAERAMAMTETADLAERVMSTLSGGEAQRVHIAAALAQEPEILLLDEPTAALDLQHQLGIHRILRSLARDDGLAVVVVTHDVNLAARMCSHALLMNRGQVVAAGTTSEVITPDKLGPVYDVELVALTRESDPAFRWLVPVESDGAQVEP